jgi:hypothetical protein
MKPIKNSNTKITLNTPEGYDETKNGPCVGLPVEQVDNVLISYWRASWKERLHVAIGRPIRLCCVGGQPPVAIDTKKALTN